MQNEALPLGPAVKELARKIAGLEPGALAELRRDSAPEGSTAFWRLWHSMTLPYPNSPWESLARIIAVLTPTGRSEGKPSAYNADRSFGQALYDAGVSDLRFSRLMATKPDERRRALLRLARVLAQNEARFNLHHLACLILFDQVDSQKRQVAKDYFNAEAKSNKSQKDTQNA